MKIAIDIRPLLEKNYTGIAFYLHHLLRSLLEIDKQNQYFLFYNQKKQAVLPDFLKKENCTFVGLNYPNKLFNLACKYLNKPAFDKILNQPDIFWAPNLNFFSFSKKNRTTKILTVHDLSFKLYPEFYSAKRLLWHKIINPQKIFNRFDHLIAISENTKNDLVDLYKIAEDKISKISSGIDHAFFNQHYQQEEVKIIKDTYRLPKNYILALSTLEPRKNFEGLIEAFNFIKNDGAFPDLELLLAGPKGWHHETIIKFYQKSPYKHQIKFLDYLKEEHKPLIYKLAALFVFPSFYEGFGFPPLEAMASGTPVVAGLNSSLPEICGRASLLVNPYSVKEIASACQQILSDENLRYKLIDRGLNQAARFSWQNCAQETLSLFEKIKNL